MDVKEEDILGDAIGDHWYYMSKGRALLDLLGTDPVSEVVDVGAGSGVFSKLLLEHGVVESAVCVDPAYAQERTLEHAGRPLRFVRSLRSEDSELVLMMDVLEHVPDDLALLEEYVRGLKAGGRVVITVPAFQALWSGHDLFLEHYRRYTLSMVSHLVRRAGLEPIAERYFFGLILPVAAGARLWDRIKLRTRHIEPRSSLRAYPPRVNRWMTAAHDLERRVIFPWNRFGGLTVFCVARKPSAA